MKTHLPTGLRKALIAAIFAVSAVAYNAQATTYTQDTRVDAINDAGHVDIYTGVTVTTTKGGVIADGITVGEGSSLRTEAGVTSDGAITLEKSSQVFVGQGKLAADGNLTAKDHTTLTLRDGGVSGENVTIGNYSTANVNGYVRAEKNLTIDDNTKVTVTNGDIFTTNSHDGRLTISNESQVSVTNGAVKAANVLDVSSTVNTTTPHLSVTGGNITAKSATVTNANVQTDRKLTVTDGTLTLNDKATVSATESVNVKDNVLINGGSALTSEGAVTAVDGVVRVTGTDSRSSLKADTVETKKENIVVENGDLTADTLIQSAKDLTVINGTISGTADIIAMGGTEEGHPKDITIVDSTVEGASLTSVQGNITIKTTDKRLAALEDHPELITSAVELTGNMKAEVGSITITKADVNVGGKVVADKGLKVEGIEVTDEETTGNTLNTGNIIVANKVLLGDVKDRIDDIIDGGGTSDVKKDMIKSAVATMTSDMKGVDIANVAEGSAVGEVTSVGDITITGSTLTAGSLTADTTEMGAAIIEAAHEGGYGEKFEKELATKLPVAKITVENSDVTVEGDVLSQTTLTVTESDFASGDIVADAGVTIKGAPKVEVDGEMQDNRNTIATGDITVENVAAIAEAVDAIAEAKAQVGGTGMFTNDEEALAALAARKDELQQSLGDVSIENVRKSTVGDVTTTGDIVIKGSKLKADSLTADATEVREALTTIIENKFGTAGVEALADALPTVSITVEDSKVNVTGKVTSDTTIDVKNGYLAAKGDVTANDGDITAENADLASAAMTAEHGAITVEGGSLNATGDVTADAGLTVSGNEEGTSTLNAGAISVVNNDAIADTKDTIAEISDKIGTIVDGDLFTKDAAIAALQAESLNLAGVTITDMAEGSAVGDVTTNGSIKISGTTMQADSLTADSTAVREDIINTIKANAKLGGAEAVEKLANLQPAESAITVMGSDVMVTGDVYSETGINVMGGDNGASLLAAGNVTAADGSINAYDSDLASADMTVEHGRIAVSGGSLDATGNVVADAGLFVAGNGEGTSSLNAASITVANKGLIAATQDTIKEINANALLSPAAKETAVANEMLNVEQMTTGSGAGVYVTSVTSGTVGDVDAVGNITIMDSTLTTGSLNADASSLREAIAGTIEEQFGPALAEQMLEEMPVAKITVDGSTLTVTGDVTSESTIDVNGGKLTAEGAVTAPETVTVNGATLKAQTIEAETLVINDGEEVTSKVKVEDTITADIAGNGGVITSTGTEGKGLTIVGNVESTGVAIRTPQGGDIVIGDVSNTIPGVGNITGKQNEVTVKGDGDISVMGNIMGAENALKVTGNGGITVNDTISGNSTTLTTKGEGDIHVNRIKSTEGTTMTAANGDITIDTLGNNEALTVTSKKGGVTLTNGSSATLKASAITAKKDITISEAESGAAMMLAEGSTVTSNAGDITVNQNIAASGEGVAITATKGTVTFAGYVNTIGNSATVTAKTIELQHSMTVLNDSTLTADTIELAEVATLNLGSNSENALQGNLSGTGTIEAKKDNLMRAADFDDTAFNGVIEMYGNEHTLTIANTGVGADAVIRLNEKSDLNVTSTGASLGTVVAGNGSDVTINAGTIDTTTTASAIAMMNGSTLNIDASADSADLITVTDGVALGAHTVHVTAQESLESIEGDVTHTIIKLADGAVNEVMSEEVKYDLVGGQRALQGKNINLVNAGDHVDLMISTNFRGTEKTKPNQTAVNAPLKELSAMVEHNPGVLAEMHSDLAHVLDALDNTRSEADTLNALQSLSAAGNLVVTNMMMDSSRNHLSTLRSHMGAPTCHGSVTGSNAWAAYTGGRDFIGSDEYTGDYTRTHQGALIGTDCSLSCNASVGIALGYEHSIGHQDSTRAEADTMFADLYTTVKQGAFTHRFSAGVAMHEIDTKRHTFVSAAAHTYTGNSTGSMDAISWNLGYELSCDMKLSSASTLTPFASVDVIFHQMDTLRENGQGDASVITEYDEPVQVDVALGAAYTYRFASGAALSASAAIHGELSEKQPEATNRFAGAGRSWTTKSAERTPVYGEIGAAVVMPVTASTSLIGGGNFEFSEDRASVGGNVGVNVKF